MSKLKKDLTLGGLTMIAIGACIGSGIFVTPQGSFAHLPHHGYVMLAWAIGGLVTYFGAMTFSELGARYPKAGGVYVFLKEAYGDLVGFLYGWIILLVVTTGALAALSMAFANYLSFFFEMTDMTKQLVGISTIAMLTAINITGVKVSDIFAKVFTGLKLAALAAIVVLGFVILAKSEVTHTLNFDLAAPPADLGNLMLLAFVGVFFSFGGWHHATYLAGETENPQRNVPRAMLIGTLTVTIVYLLVIFSYSLLLPMADIISSDRVAGDAVANAVSGGGKLVAVAISISIFGTIGIYTMSAPRIYYAMAKDGVFFTSLAKLHPKYKTPHYAMIFQGVWAIFLILILTNFHNLMTFATFMDIVFMALATSTIFIFRKRQQSNTASESPTGLNKPAYLLKLYPLIPILYLLVTVAFVVNQLANMNLVTYLGPLILALGIPTFYFFKNKSQKTNS